MYVFIFTKYYSNGTLKGAFVVVIVIVVVVDYVHKMHTKKKNAVPPSQFRVLTRKRCEN